MYKIIYSILIATLLFSCGKSDERYELNQNNLDKIKPMLFAKQHIDSIILRNNYVFIKFKDQKDYMDNAIITGSPAQLFYNFPNLNNIDFQLYEWWGYYSMRINRKEYSQFWKVDLKNMNDSIWKDFLNGNGDLEIMFAKQEKFNEKFVEYNYKDKDSKERYLGIGKYATKKTKEESNIKEKDKTYRLLDYAAYDKIDYVGAKYWLVLSWKATVKEAEKCVLSNLERHKEQLVKLGNKLYKPKEIIWFIYFDINNEIKTPDDVGGADLIFKWNGHNIENVKSL